jgi:uncharacterized protein (DUF952 family)
LIFHILKKDEWQRAVQRGCYEPASLKTEGFVHCSTREQAPDTAHRYYYGQTDLVLLSIDASRLTAELRLEPPANPHDERAHELFPHVYGPINLDAVRHAVDFACDSAGSFPWPPAIS